MMLRHTLLDNQGNISAKAGPEDLEIICSDPTYAHLLDQVPQHPACWTELAEWIALRHEDPVTAGAPPEVPAHVGRRPRWHTSIPHLSNPLAALHVPALPHKPILMLGALLSAFVILMVAAPHLIGSASAGTSDPSMSTVRAANQEDVFSDARVVEQRARKSPVWDEQLRQQTEVLDQAMKNGDSEKAEILSSKLDDMRLQKTRVRIGDVTSSLSDSIEWASALKDAPVSDSKKTMTALSDAWSAKSVDEANLLQAEKAAQQFRQSIDVVQKDQDKAIQDKKKEEERRKAQAEQEARAAVKQQDAQQPAPQQVNPQQQTVPQQQVPQQRPQAQQNRSVPQGGGTDGVTIG